MRHEDVKRFGFAPGWLALTAVLGLSCSDEDTTDETEPTPQVVESEGWTVSAATPVLQSDGTVIGSVTFERTSGAETRGGGVCLVADLYDSTPCTTAADCDGLDVPEGGFHYCRGVNGSTERSCWTRPGEEGYCHRNPANAPGTFTTSAVPGLVDGVATRWMANACMAISTSPMGCGSTDPAQSVTATSPTLDVTP